MVLKSANAKTNSLKNDYGSSKGSNSPATWYMAFFEDDTMATELTGTGGISRIAVTNNDANWTTATVTQNAGVINSAASTGAWASSATFVALMSAATGGDAWDGGDLADPISVSAAGTVIQFAAGAFQVGA